MRKVLVKTTAEMTSVALYLLLLIAIMPTNSLASTQVSQCNYPLAQQHFSLETTGLDGCHRLDSITRIFGEANGADFNDRFVATRFATANLVFVGRVLPPTKTGDSSGDDSARVEPECFLKGRLFYGQPVLLTGLRQSLSNSVCRDSRLRPRQRAIFFATALAASGSSSSSLEIRLNENGVESDVNRTLDWLRCKDNKDFYEKSSSDYSCWMTADPPSAACNGVSLPIAMRLLEQLSTGVTDLRPECRGALLHRVPFELANMRLGPSAAAVKSGDNNSKISIGSIATRNLLLLFCIASAYGACFFVQV
ncbi:hypothetical protein BOX15_Mlig026377g1 [Macrostomum lignano]|uniref:Uncharacterized protein n=2 Tax=Macrostomum lignano TaxID=282301 RepID=A0A1I8JGF8_9PLAT|nr:hypothetical protein BOX15_Mlig026377g1 [Macrostomum lignano]